MELSNHGLRIRSNKLNADIITEEELNEVESSIQFSE